MFCFWRRRGSPGRAEGALKRRARNSGVDAAREVLRTSSVFSVDRSVLVPFDRSSWSQTWACDRQDYSFETPPPSRAVLWAVGVGVAVVPVASLRRSRFIASIVVIDATNNSSRMSRGRRTMPPQVGLPPKLDFDLQQKVFCDFFYLRPNQICMPPKINL